jgi:DNA (cytosine-5)-methyltransferase 1/site-specific DNA-methyltransferase (adenine-specific)
MENRLILGDSFEEIDKLINDGLLVDHIITDPPYNIAKKNNFHSLEKPRKGIDFGKWDYDFDLTGWIEKYIKLLKKGGSIIIFSSYLNISFIARELEKFGMVIKDLIIWEKKNPMPRNRDRRYVQDTEYAIWAVKPGEKWVFNRPDDLPYKRARYVTSVVSGKEKNGHPTQKSLELMIDIIKTHTNENDLIIDPFMGSGTTCVASIICNRKFIGIELDSDYYNIALRRVNEIITSNVGE